MKCPACGSDMMVEFAVTNAALNKHLSEGRTVFKVNYIQRRASCPCSEGTDR